jgi:hypothetical protein
MLLCSREAFNIGLIYVAEGQETQGEIARNTAENCSNLYKEFMEGLGWQV